MPGDTNGNATFSITVTNSSGNRILVTNDDIADGSFVTIDTVKPLIILNGNSNDTVLQGNNYTDLGANVYDLNNPSYTENVTATTNLNTSLLGVQNITYSALADTAGNVPDSINRTVTVLAKPLGLVTLTITNNNAVNSLYAKAGDFIDLNFVANGTIGSGTVTIASNTIAHISFYDERFVVSYILASSIADTDSLEFTITVTNEDNTTTSTFTEANLTGPSIIIDNTAHGSVYELFVYTMVLLLPTSVMVGAVLSIIMLGPVRFASVNVLVVVLSSLVTVMVNSRLSVSAIDEARI